MTPNDLFPAFIDTHQHLIYRDRLGYGWTSGVPALAMADFTLQDYAALVAGHWVAGSVFMETGVDDGDYQAEARLVAGLVGSHGLLGQVASCRPEVDDGFDAWLAECGDLHVKGFRRILHVVPDEISQSQTFRNNLRKIGAQGLVFDMCFLPRQLPLAMALAQACDQQILVLDHCGTPDIASGDFVLWAAGIKALSALPHVYCKLSGLPAYCGKAATLGQLTPWVSHVLNCFGPDRMVWGSDWPVVNLGGGLQNWIDLSRQLIATLSPHEQTAIAQDNARRIYQV